MKIKDYYKRIAVLTFALIVSFVATTVYLRPYNNALEAVVYKYGSKDEVVSQIQTKLKKWGYYSYSVDGIYGYQTYTSVKYFQRKNGLGVDGVAGPKTLAALGINAGSGGDGGSSGNSSSNDQNLMLLARIINGEARGEPYEGQVAVGGCVLNRVSDSRFPSTIAGVIYQPGAFTAVADGQINAALKQTSVKAAQDALNGWDPSGGAVYYFNPATATSKWIWSRPLIKVIGKHRFCS